MCQGCISVIYCYRTNHQTLDGYIIVSVGQPSQGMDSLFRVFTMLPSNAGVSSEGSIGEKKDLLLSYLMAVGRFHFLLGCWTEGFSSELSVSWMHCQFFAS